MSKEYDWAYRAPVRGCMNHQEIHDLATRAVASTLDAHEGLPFDEYVHDRLPLAAYAALTILHSLDPEFPEVPELSSAEFQTYRSIFLDMFAALRLAKHDDAKEN